MNCNFCGAESAIESGFCKFCESSQDFIKESDIESYEDGVMRFYRAPVPTMKPVKPRRRKKKITHEPETIYVEVMPWQQRLNHFALGMLWFMLAFLLVMFCAIVIFGLGLSVYSWYRGH